MSVPERVRNHWWWRPGWRAGRPIYSWHFILPSDETIRAHAAAYQEVLSAYDVLDIVPLEWLHMTTQDVCFADEISDADRDAMVEDVRGRLRSHEPFTVTFGAPTVWTEGVVLLPEPNAPFAAV
ncbi:MAG TPA: 2'-5' RNA ligase family protein, partial [Actinopolymorphaceae bacterium]